MAWLITSGTISHITTLVVVALLGWSGHLCQLLHLWEFFFIFFLFIAFFATHLGRVSWPMSVSGWKDHIITQCYIHTLVRFVFASLFSDRGSQDTNDAKPITGGKVTLICIAPRREHTSKALRYGTRSQGISQFYLHTPRSSANGINHTCIFLPSRSWSSFTDPGGVEGWVGLGGGYMNYVNHKSF